MKILLLTPWYPDQKQPNHGIFIRDQVRALTNHGHEVKVVCAKVDYSRFGIFRYRSGLILDGQIEEYHLDVAGSLPVFNQVNFLFIAIRHTLRVSRSFKPDLIHGNIGYPGAFWSWVVSKIEKIPVVLTEHTLLHNNFRSLIHRLLTITYLKKLNRVITVSKHSASIIQNLTSINPIVIPNIVDFSAFDSIHPFPSLATIHIGFLGNGFRKKGLDTLFRALSQVNGSFKILIGGTDCNSKEFHDLAEELGILNHCEFCGPLARMEVPVFMSRLHFFVSASLFESFGVAIAEAMACGLPVVCTNSGGPSDFVNESNGMIVPVGDAEKLGQAIEQMMSRYNQYDRKSIRENVVNRFSPDMIVKQLEEVYISLK